MQNRPSKALYNKISFSANFEAEVDQIYRAQLKLTLRANKMGLIGWVRRRRNEVIGVFVCLWRDVPSAKRLLAEAFADNLDVMCDSHFYDKFKSGFSLRWFCNLADVDFSHDWHQRSVLMLDQVNEKGEVCGWAYSPVHPDEPQTIRVFVDNAFAFETKAGLFREDLLMKGVGGGHHGFRGKLPLVYFDGEHHKIRAELVLEREDANINRNMGPLKLPLAQTLSRGWRNTNGLSPANILRSRIIESGLDSEGVASLVCLWDSLPESVFVDFGIAERCARENKPFLSFRERLAHRFVSENCPELIRRFQSKAFTKQYCAAKGIPTPKTLLLSREIEELNAFSFPERFVCKPIIGSGEATYLWSDGFELRSRAKMTLNEMLDEISLYLKVNPGSKFIVEELVQQNCASERVIPLDYKISVFGGKARIVLVVDRNGSSLDDSARTQFGWFSRNWLPTPFPFKVETQESINFRPPEFFDEMISIAEAIGSDCKDYVRVDLYESNRGVLLGEVTTFPGAGLYYTDFGERIMCQLWHISILHSSTLGFQDWMG